MDDRELLFAVDVRADSDIVIFIVLSLYLIVAPSDLKEEDS